MDGRREVSRLESKGQFVDICTDPSSPHQGWTDCRDWGRCTRGSECCGPGSGRRRG